MLRLRLAPSPTGYVHLGTLRTALYGYLFVQQAKQRGEQAEFILRIEDTDQKRGVEQAVGNLIMVLLETGIKFNNVNDLELFGPQKIKEGERIPDWKEIITKFIEGSFREYIQSNRLELYQKYARELWEKGLAYPCFCTAERLEELRQKQQTAGRSTGYDRHCLSLSKEETQKLIDAGKSYVLRMKIPRERTIKLNDLVRGEVAFNCAELDDQVLLKSDGFPTYHLAVVVDDHLMEITHVTRTEEWLPSTPKHLLLYEFFGWQPPLFAHFPLILNPDRTKMSKRKGDVSVGSYLEKGYLPEALISYLALLGWNPGTEQEVFTIQELIEQFEITKIHKAGAVFDVDKLKWMNGMFIRKMELGKLVELVIPYLDKQNWFKNVKCQMSNVKCHLERCVKLIQEKLKLLSEAPEMLEFFFHEMEFEQSLFLNDKMGVDAKIARMALSEGQGALEKIEEKDWKEEKIKEVLMSKVGELNWKNGQLLWPLRVALTGKLFSPGVFEVAEVLGKKESLTRIQHGLEKFN